MLFLLHQHVCIKVAINETAVSCLIIHLSLKIHQFLLHQFLWPSTLERTGSLFIKWFKNKNPSVITFLYYIMSGWLVEGFVMFLIEGGINFSPRSGFC